MRELNSKNIIHQKNSEEKEQQFKNESLEKE